MSEALAIKEGTNSNDFSIPEILLKEEFNGVKFYYKGFMDVVNKTKQPEDIMGSSGLQSILISYLLRLCFEAFENKKYWVLTNELGANYGRKQNFAFDIAVIEKTKLPGSDVNAKYVGVPPKILIEVDVRTTGLTKKGDKITGMNIVSMKTEKMLELGTEKIIWVLSPIKKVLVVTNDATPWELHDWNSDILLADNYSFNVGKYLSEEGIDIEQIL